MPPKKKPLEDARKRLQEKLCNVEEQSEYICQFINDLVDKASSPAKELLVEKDRKKFFQKYSSVSQELEKCLDCLLLISDSVTALGEEDTLGTNEDCSSSASESSDHSSHGAISRRPVPRATLQVPSEKKETKPEKQDTIPVNREETASNAATDSIAQQVVKTSYENVSQSVTSDPQKYKQSLPKTEGTVQETESCVSKSIQEHVQKPVSNSSGQDLDSRRSAQGAECPKPINQQQTEQAVSQRVERTTEKKRSPSTSSVLSDLLQDIQVSPREESTVGNSKTLKAVKLKSYPFINGEAIEVVVTEVISPWEFWVQPVGTELDLLMEEMCMHYAKLAAGGYKGGLTTTPTVAEFCCAKFTQDDTWYRAMVTKVEQTHQGPLVEVFCVDDGNRESLGLSRLRPLEEKFAKLPCQALCCALSGVRPIPATPLNKPGSGVVSTLWGQKSVEWLKSKVSGQKLLAFPTRTGASDLIIIDLYATSLGKSRSKDGRHENSLPRLEFNISEMMLRAGMAQRVGEPAQEPSSSSGSSLSGGSGESLTRCSSVSIGSSVEDGGVCAPQNSAFVCGYEDCSTDHSSSSRETVLRTFERVPKDANRNAVKRSISEGKQKNSDSEVNTFKQCTSKEKRSGSDANAKNLDAFKHKRSTAEEKGSSNDGKAKNVTALKRSESEEKRSSSDLSAKNINAFKRSTSDAYIEDGSKEPTLSRMSELTDERRKGEKTREQKQDLVPSEPYATLHQEGHETADSGATSITELLPIEGPMCLQMIMSNVVSVNEFYVHLVTPEAGLLDSMMEDLNSYYNSDPLLQGNSFQPRIGDHCCARFKEDRRWYRGLVTSLRCTVDEREGPQYESVEVEVFHIDFGSSEWVSAYDVKPLVPRFMTLPGQVVKCELANIVPAITEDMATATTESDSQSKSTESAVALLEQKFHPEVKQKLEEKPQPENKSLSEETLVDSSKPVTNSDVSPYGKSRKKGSRKKKKQKPSLVDQRVLVIAAGDESNDSSELSEFEFAKPTPKEENAPGKQKEGDNMPAKRTEEDTSSTDKNAFPEKYLMPSPDKVIPSVNERQTDRDNQEWAHGTKELFEGLTDDCRVLVGYMVPWDPWVYQQLFDPDAAGGLKVDVTYKRPILSLNLYDTTGDEDIFINQVLVEVGVANFVENPKVDATRLKLSQANLEAMASSMNQQGFSVWESTSPQETHGQRVTSPTSPLGDWDPMKDDFLSIKNTYAVDTDDLDIAIQGYQDLSRRVCHFYSTRSGCWSGDECPNLHVKKGDELRELVEVFCDNMDSSVTLPDIGTWVAVRVTAVFNPGHFWVQFPYGPEPIENRILAARMGLENDNEEFTDQKDEDLDSLMERMGKFYSRNLCQDPRRILPAVGELCVAKYSKDNKWYRARITSVDEEELQVFFVDYGNSEWTPENHVKRMLPHFLHLPFQAVECFLGNVVPKKAVEQKGHMQDWSKEALETFHTLTEDKLLIAHILSRAWNRTIYVDLFDTDKEEIHINKVLVQKGFALESDYTVNYPWNIEATVNFNPHKMVGLPG